MAFDYSKLRGRSKETYGTQHKLAKSIGMGRVSLSKRLNNSLEFTQNDMELVCKALEIEVQDIPAYFLHQKFRNANMQT